MILGACGRLPMYGWCGDFGCVKWCGCVVDVGDDCGDVV